MKDTEYYLAKKTLRGLYDYIHGYSLAIYDITGNIEGFLGIDFQKFVEKQYDLHNNINVFRFWLDIIQFFTENDELAFDEFYRLYDLYLEVLKDDKKKAIEIEYKSIRYQ